MKKKTRHSVYVSYKENRRGGGIREEEIGEAWPNYEDTDVDWYLTGISVEHPEDPYHDEVEVDFIPEEHVGKEVYAIVARYSDGDTFSRTNGLGYPVAVGLTSEEADGILEAVKQDTYKGYKPWKGYFSRLETVEIHTSSLRQKVGDHYFYHP